MPPKPIWLFSLFQRLVKNLNVMHFLFDNIINFVFIITGGNEIFQTFIESNGILLLGNGYFENICDFFNAFEPVRGI